MNTIPVLAVIVPCFNEEAVLPEAMRRLDMLLLELVGSSQIHEDSRVWYVDDGSRDRTWLLIQQAADHTESRSAGVKLSRNRGHQIALLAGLMHAKGDVLISVDADLQDDLAVIPQMLRAYAAGSDIVFGVRSTRATDTFFKRVTAEGYYRLLKKLGVEIVFNHADYRLMSRRAVESLRCFQESNIFLRGMIPLLGYATSCIEYERAERFAGESKYPVGKMLALAWQGVTSFSAVPLRAITALGAVVSLISISMGIWALAVRLFTNDALPGWASIVIPQFLLSGAQLLSLGVIGEYLAKIFIETKRRPPYFIEALAVGPNSAQPLRGRSSADDTITSM